MDLSFFMTFDHSMSSESWQKIFTDIFAPSFLSYDARLCVFSRTNTIAHLWLTKFYVGYSLQPAG
jgi:hypothetical protein